jgi:hypothetical protein
MLSLRSLSFALTLLILLAYAARAQSGSTASVTLNGHVSGTVLLSVSPTAQLSDDKYSITSHNLNAHTILVSIKTGGGHARQIAIPVQIRSNVGYALSASAKLGGATSTHALRGIQVTGARPTGKFVAVDAVAAMNVAQAVYAMNAAGQSQRASRGALLTLFPATLLTGPRISLGGTPDSPHNAVEVMILAEVEASTETESQSIELILSATPNGATSSPALAQN